MKQTKLIRMLAFILVIVMMLEMGPMQVFATGSGANTEYATQSHPKKPLRRRMRRSPKYTSKEK